MLLTRTRSRLTLVRRSALLLDREAPAQRGVDGESHQITQKHAQEHP